MNRDAVSSVPADSILPEGPRTRGAHSPPDDAEGRDKSTGFLHDGAGRGYDVIVPRIIEGRVTNRQAIKHDGAAERATCHGHRDQGSVTRIGEQRVRRVVDDAKCLRRVVVDDHPLVRESNIGNAEEDYVADTTGKETIIESEMESTKYTETQYYMEDLKDTSGDDAEVKIEFETNETNLRSEYGPILDLDGDGSMSTANVVETGTPDILPTKRTLTFDTPAGTRTYTKYIVIRR